MDARVKAAVSVAPESFGVSVADLKDKVYPPVQFVVEGILPEGCTILGGRPKLGKSWLGYDIGVNVARAGGGYVLGDRRCAEGDVLYLALEDNERRLQGRLRKMIPFGDWPARLTVSTQWPRARDGGLDKIRRWCRTVVSPKLVIVDVLAQFRSAPGPNDRKTDYQLDYETVAGLRDLANELSLAVLIVHHVRKGESSDDPVEAISGTLGIAGAADTFLILNRKAETGVTLYGRGRDIEEFDVALEWLVDTCRWKIKGTTAEVKRSDERSQILEALRDAGEALTPAEIAADTGMRSGNVRRLVGKMVRDGELMKEKGARYRVPPFLRR